MIEVDTGTSLSIISEATYRNLWQSNKSQLQPTEKVLSNYTSESLEVQGSLSVLVEYSEQKSQLELPHKHAATVCIPWPSSSHASPVSCPSVPVAPQVC